jgi:hypothetical protein
MALWTLETTLRAAHATSLPGLRALGARPTRHALTALRELFDREDERTCDRLLNDLHHALYPYGADRFKTLGFKRDPESEQLYPVPHLWICWSKSMVTVDTAIRLSKALRISLEDLAGL